MAGYLLDRRAVSRFAFCFQSIRAIPCTRVSNLNTIKRTLCTLGLLLLFGHAASAQSILNFSRVLLDSANNTGIAITNPSPYPADVLLTLYGPDGNSISNGNATLNPISYRIDPKSQIQVLASDLFGLQNAEGWVQATSLTSGLMGFYFTGDFNSTLDGSESLTPMSAQVLPLISEDQSAHTDLLIVNPGATAGPRRSV